MGRGDAWLDNCPQEIMLEAGNFARTQEERQGPQTGCPDKIAFRKGWITVDNMRRSALRLTKNTYGKYLLSLIGEES